MNVESYPATLYPLRGDVSAEAGATTVEVIGLQGLLLGVNPLTDGGKSVKNSAASVMVISSTSAMDLPRYLTSRVSRL